MRQRKSQALIDAKKFYKLLLYEASGGNLGTKPEKEVKNQTADFAEKKGLLAEIIKLAVLEQKAIEDQPEVSGLDMLRRGLQNGSGSIGSERDFGGAAESPSDESSDNLSTEP
jgi:hypothetical protein